ncbi:hypothetical protein CARUB_v10010836mg [Capsella rubella]|uniref:Prolamin-like domain-containing protein n=1 Tax=Capsella rubella TaxID=81985 RepID=R0GKU0_9BRAS|nr:uncharacterized protein LOC17900512 [Capsella rubella]EOA36396.1 hypothetical protein CARUB_v10010836mg [Capsella rubella]
MKTSMSMIIIFFVTFFAISASSLNPEEDCIQRNIDRSQPPSLSLEPPKTSKVEAVVDKLCGDMARAVMFSVRITGKFPSHYVKSMCNVFGNDDKKVKEYVVKKWLGGSKLASSLSCAFP